MIGKIINNYKIVSILGEGGMGTVYKAYDIKLERFVAIKILSSKFISNQNSLERFKREAKNHAKLIHPNIVSVFDFTDEDNVLGIVMEYVEGETLEKLIRKNQQINYVDALNILKQILSGVGYAHSKGFVHRDIKPSNIIINNDGLVKIMDFGIAKAIYEKGITKTGSKIGTVLYMSPEQIKGEEATKQSDIYSIGIIFYEMLTGKNPFDLETEFEVMEAHLKKYPPRVSAINKTIPVEVDKIIIKSLEKSNLRRYKDCEEFLEDTDYLLAKYKTKSIENELIKKKETEQKNEKIKKAKYSFFTLLLFLAFCGIIILAFLAVKNYWPDLKKNFYKNKDNTSVQIYNTNIKSKINWETKKIASNQNLHSIYFINDSVGFVVGELGLFMKTNDGGLNWNRLSLLDSINFYSIDFINEKVGFIIGEKGVIYRTLDGGEHWIRSELDRNINFFKIYSSNFNNIFITGSQGTILKSTNNGETWRKVFTNTSLLIYSISFCDYQNGFAVGWNGTILQTNDGGENWFSIKSFTDNYIRDIYFINDKIGITCGGDGEIFRTENGGKSWNKIKINISSGLYSIFFINDKRGFISSLKGEILETNDAGENWEITQSGNYSSLSNFAITTSKKVFLCGNNGIILTLKNS